jgi:hypothetical protein
MGFLLLRTWKATGNRDRVYNIADLIRSYPIAQAPFRTVYRASRRISRILRGEVNGAVDEGYKTCGIVLMISASRPMYGNRRTFDEVALATRDSPLDVRRPETRDPAFDAVRTVVDGHTLKESRKQGSERDWKPLAAFHYTLPSVYVPLQEADRQLL